MILLPEVFETKCSISLLDKWQQDRYWDQQDGRAIVAIISSLWVLETSWERKKNQSYKSQLRVLLPWGGWKQLLLGLACTAALLGPAAEALFSDVYLKNTSSQKTVMCSIFDPNPPVTLLSLHYPSQNDALPMLYYLSVHSQNTSWTSRYITKHSLHEIQLSKAIF